MKPIDPQITATPRNSDQLGKALRRFRSLRGLSQTELGKKSGIAQAKISLIESGKRRPETSTLYHLLNALGVDLVLRARAVEE